MEDIPTTGAERPTQTKAAELDALYTFWTAKKKLYNVHRCLSQYVSDPHALLLLLRQTDGVIAGDVPTLLLMGFRDEDWDDTKMDILLPCGPERRALDLFIGFFMKDEYREASLDELQSDTAAVFRHPDLESILFRKEKKVHILKMDTACPLSKVPDNYGSTAAMNAITGTHVVPFFPHLTFSEFLMFPTMAMIRPCRGQVKSYESRGWSRGKFEEAERYLRKEESVNDKESELFARRPEKEIWIVSGRISKGLAIREDGQLRRPSISPHEDDFAPCDYEFYLVKI